MLPYHFSISRGSSLAVAAFTVAAVAASTMAAVAASPAMLADYKAANYNVSQGLWTDSSGNDNNASLVYQQYGEAAPTLTANATPNGSSAVNFNGSNEFLAIDGTVGLPQSSTGYTVMAFIQPQDTGSGTYAIVGGSPGAMEYRLQYGNYQALLREDVAGMGTSNDSVPTNSFSSIGVATDNAGNAIFYFNGNADGNAVAGTNTVFTSPINTIGAADSGSSIVIDPADHFLGNIAELQIYSGVLTASQVQAIDQSFTSAYVTPVPEPAPLVFLAVVAVGLLLLKRRRRAV